MHYVGHNLYENSLVYGFMMHPASSALEHVLVLPCAAMKCCNNIMIYQCQWMLLQLPHVAN